MPTARILDDPIIPYLALWKHATNATENTNKNY